MNNRFDWAILEAINNAISTVKASPLILGGVTGSGGGAGGPIGGVVGYLTQTRVAYDLSEVESSGVPASGMSLLDNLNHIRYRVGVIESGGSGHFIEDEGIPLTDRPTLNFIGSGVTVYDDELNNETVVSISGSEGVVSFIDLTDTPSEYSGNTGKAAIVNSTEDGIEFGTINNGITVFSGGGEVISGATGIDFIGAGVAYSGLTATVTITQSGGGAFQRVLSENLTLASGESLVIAEYLDLASNDFTLDGDSILYFVDDHTKDYNTIAVWDDAVPVGDFLTLDLIGDQITITPSGTVVRVEVAVPSGTGITDAPSNDIYYGRRNSGWTNLKTYFDTIYTTLSDAPSDGVYYARRNAAWTNIKTYFDTLYSTLSSMSAANALDLTDGGITDLHSHESTGTWIAPSLGGAWVNFGSGLNPVGYYKDSMGIVHLRGVIKDGTITTTLFVLPIGFRPPYEEVFVTISNDAIGRLNVVYSGEVIPKVGNNAWFSLDGISFSTF